MDMHGKAWYFSSMNSQAQIPHFNLFGETSAFPDVIHCERVFDRARLHDWVISPHRHSHMAQVLHIENGLVDATLDGQAIQLTDGEYLYVPPRIVHGFAFSCGTEGAVLSFPVPVVAGIGPENAALLAWLGAVRRGRLSDICKHHVVALAAVYAKTGIFRAQKLVAQTHLLLACLAEESHDAAAPMGDPERQIARLDALVAKHLGERWSARDYAQALHVTTGHLNRQVRAATGVSLTSYLETAAMTEACRLIAFTRLPFAEVGYRIGYDDPSYFSRRFRMRIGETPSQYRSRVAGE